MVTHHASRLDLTMQLHMAQAILLTGSPGCGKTTLLQRVLAQLREPVGGFYTQEIRESGGRTGFGITTLDGQQGVLASVKIKSPKRVGRYGVNLSDLDGLAARSIEEAVSSKKIVLIDEIGPMEILSERLRKAVMNALQSESPILGTIVKRSLPFTDQIKVMPQVTVIEVSRDNREDLVGQILSFFQRGSS